MRFLDVILGALIAAPMRLLPVMNMPLEIQSKKTNSKGSERPSTDG